MNELCVRFPIVAAHNTAASFAIACPEMAHADAAMALSAAQSPVALYHLSTGVKTHVLVVDSSRGARGQGAGGINPLAPVAQVRDTGDLACAHPMRHCSIAFAEGCAVRGVASASCNRCAGCKRHNHAVRHVRNRVSRRRPRPRRLQPPQWLRVRLDAAACVAGAHVCDCGTKGASFHLPARHHTECRPARGAPRAVPCRGGATCGGSWGRGAGHCVCAVLGRERGSGGAVAARGHAGQHSGAVPVTHAGGRGSAGMWGSGAGQKPGQKPGLMGV